MGRIPIVVKNLLIINILFLLAQTVLPFGSEFTNRLALHYWDSPDFSPYQFVTYMFLHGDISHLFFNMFALWMFGRVAEYDMGSKRFLLYYMATGIGAALFNMGVTELELGGIKRAIAEFTLNPNPTDFSLLVSEYFPRVRINDSFVTAWALQPESATYNSEAILAIKEMFSVSTRAITVGASGAVYGILLAFGVMHPNDRIMLLIPPIPMKAKYFVLAYAILELILGVSNSGGSIAHFAHLGGMIFGWLLLRHWKKRGLLRY